MAAQVVIHVGGGVNVPTLAIAILGLTLSAASLTWQTASFRLSGPRVKLRLLRGFLMSDEIVSAPVDAPDPAQMMTRQGREGTPLLGVSVKNVGRMPTTIESASAKTNTGVEFSQPRWHINPEQNYRLEPHSSATWWVPMEAVARVVAATAAMKPEWNHPQDLRMAVSLASGRTITTRQHLTIEP